MTDSDTQKVTWKPIPGFSRYFAGDNGEVYNTQTRDIQATTISNSGYELVKMISDEGRRETKTVHGVVLLAHEGPCPEGKEARHWNDDPLDNRWAPGGEEACRAGLGNLLYGTKEENRADRARNRPPKPKPAPKPCINHARCGNQVDKGGRRCHECVVQLGVDGAELCWSGMTLEAAGAQLDYPPVHLHTLMVRYGGYGQRPPAPAPQSRSVFATVRGRFRRGDGA